MNFFNIFNKKTTIRPLTWNDITIEKAEKIQEILEVQDEYTALNLIQYLWGVDPEDIPQYQLSEYLKACAFITKEPKNVKLKKHYHINGRDYDSNFDLTVLSAAQFVDYQNYTKQGKLNEILSVFFVPKNHKYNDGYDLTRVQEDLLQLDFPTAKSAAFFFEKSSGIYAILFRYYLIRKVRKNKEMKKQDRKALIDNIRKLDFKLLVSSPLWLCMLKKRQHP